MVVCLNLCLCVAAVLVSSMQYSDDEAEKRFKYFRSFLTRVDERNEREATAAAAYNGGAAVHGITKFADYAPEEFQRLLGYRRQVSAEALQRGPRNYIKRSVPSAEVTSVDWTGVYTTAVKDQGYCGSCWAFSATEQVESDSIRTGLLTTSDALSPQDLVSCDSTCYGCDGGYTVYAYEYMSSNGIEKESDYPYTSYNGDTGTCTASVTESVVSAFHYLLYFVACIYCFN